MKNQEKIKDFSRMQKEELERILRDKKEKLRELRFNLVAGKVKNVREVREMKKDIARILTLLKQKELYA